MLQTTTGCLVDPKTGDVLDAGLILAIPGAGTVVDHGPEGRPMSRYAMEDLPSIKVLPFSYSAN